MLLLYHNIITQISLVIYIYENNILSTLLVRLADCTSKSSITISLTIILAGTAFSFSQSSFLKVKESPTKEITVITDRVMKVYEPDMTSLCTRKEEARREATYPSEPVDGGVHNQWTSEHGEHSLRQDIRHT